MLAPSRSAVKGVRVPPRSLGFERSVESGARVDNGRGSSRVFKGPRPRVRVVIVGGGLGWLWEVYGDQMGFGFLVGVSVGGFIRWDVVERSVFSLVCALLSCESS